MNSKVMWFFLKNTGTELSGGYFRFKTNYLKPFPLPEIPDNPNLMIDKVNSMLSLNSDLQKLSSKFLGLLLSELGINEPSKVIQKWYALDFAEFSKELKKKKVELSLAQKSEWLTFFEEEKTKAQAIATQISQTDKEIDSMVYALYGLNEEEVKIVEGN